MVSNSTVLPTTTSTSRSSSPSVDADDKKRKRRLNLPPRVDRFFHIRRYRRSRLFTPLLLLFILLVVIAIILAAVFSYSSSTLKQRGSSSQFGDDVLDLLELYGRVQAVDVPGGKISVLWSIYAYSFNPNSTLFFPGAVEATGVGFLSGYPDYPIDIYMNENCTVAGQDHDSQNVITSYNPKIRNFGYDPLVYTDYTNPTKSSESMKM